jgi:hypothetical protein
MCSASYNCNSPPWVCTQLKNITDPVRVYRDTAQGIAGTSPTKPTFALPDKRSIAVLTFTNLSGDPARSTSVMGSRKTS